MLIRSWLDILKSRISRTASWQPPSVPKRRRPTVSSSRPEQLEDRSLLAFDLTANYAVGTGPGSSIVADFNNDGQADLAVVNSNSNNVSVLLGNDDGTFQPSQNTTTGANPVSLAVGDFNNDDNLDLVTANRGGISVLLGNGDGSFQPPANFSIGSDNSSVAVGDLNDDGKLDLAATSNIYYPPYFGYYGSYPAYYEGRVDVLLGNGAGSFGTPTSSALGIGYRTGAVIADVTADGTPDIATINSEYGLVTVMPGNGNGSFGPILTSNGIPAQTMTVGDINADGKLDLLTANSSGNSVSVLLGNGQGAFAFDSDHTYPVGAASTSVAMADMNGDGFLDIVSANTNETVSVLLGTGEAGTAAFRPPVITAVAAGTQSLKGLVLGTFNDDNLPDVATSVPNDNNVAVLLNDGAWPALTDPSITIADVTVVEGNTDTTTVTFTVSLSAASELPISVDYSTADNSAIAGSDYIATSGTVIIPAGLTSQTFTVPVNGDRLYEPANETFLVQLTNSTHAFLADATGVATITDDEPTISIASGASSLEGNSGTTPFIFTVTLSAAYDVPVTVEYSTADLTPDEQYWYGTGAIAGLDYTAASGVVTFEPGITSMPITVDVLGDRLAEYDELFFLNLANATNSFLITSQSMATIVDDEPKVSISFGTSQPEGNSGTQPMLFMVTLGQAYDEVVTVDYATADESATAGVDYQAATGTLTFAPGVTSLPINVLINGDQLGEFDEVFAVNVTGGTSAFITSGASFGTIQNDEPAVTVDNASVREGKRHKQLMTFTAHLSAATDQPVNVHYATNDWTAKADKDYRATSGVITFNAGQTASTFTVTIKGDKKREPDETFFITLSDVSANAVIQNNSAAGTILTDERFRRHHRQVETKLKKKH